MAIIGLFQCDPCCLPTQKWLKNATNVTSIQEIHTIRHTSVFTIGKTCKDPVMPCKHLQCRMLTYSHQAQRNQNIALHCAANIYKVWPPYNAKYVCSRGWE